MADVLVLIGDPATERTVRASLTQHRVVDADHAQSSPEVDLILTDGGGLKRHPSLVEAALSAAYPVFLPLLAVLGADEEGPLCISLGAFDLIRAPFDAETLRARVDTLLHLRSLSQVQQLSVVRADARLEGANRALRTLSACNELATRARSEADLLDRACQMIVSEGGYLAAWVGYADDNPDKTVSIQAHAGGLGDYIRTMDISWGEGPLGQGPFGRALRSARPATSQDIACDPGFEPWREQALRYGLGSVIALPLCNGSWPFGALAIYATEAHVFAPHERELLARAANSLAHGVQVLRDRAENLRSQARIAHLAFNDQLTGLPNRAGLINALTDMLQDRSGDVRGGAVLFIDLDGFKLINDALGHRTGDRVLVQVAERLRRIVRAQDLVGRQGGDEFIVLVPHVPRLENGDAGTEADRLRRLAADVAERVIAALRVPFVIQGGERYLGASIGISLFPKDASRVTRLLSQADSAMYHAKSRGGGCVAFYTTALSRVRKRRLSLETQLHKAVERGEFQLHYQPIVDLRDQRMCAVEALLRWPRPEGSTPLPTEFVPILEETGLIVPLGEWVVHEACRALNDLTPLAPDLSVAVNLSVNQLWQPRLADMLVRTVESQAVNPNRIELEITEGAMASGPERAERNVRALCESGFRIALDDFGTGYSSLDRLRYLPITTIKVDKRFLNAAPADHGSAVLVTSIVRLGHSLGLRTVAEGVETEAQHRFLTELDCDNGQGHLFSTARPLAGIRQLLRGADPVPAG